MYYRNKMHKINKIFICFASILTVFCDAGLPANPEKEVDFLIGACTHHAGHGYNSIPMLEQIGAKIVRDEMSWQEVEKRKGDFSVDLGMLAYMFDLNARNIKPLMILNYSNTLYAADNKYGPNSPELLEAFGRYVSFLVSTFKGKVYAWEIWNEPDSKLFWLPGPSAKDYSLLVKYVAPIIRQNDPQALIVAGALTGANFDYLDSLVQEGALSDVDVISCHWYTQPYDPGSGRSEKGLADIQGLWRTINKLIKPAKIKMDLVDIRVFVQVVKNLGKRAWLTEIGYPTSNNFAGVSEEKQAEYLEKQLNLAKDMGVETCIIYDLMDDGPDASDHEQRFGLFRGDRSPKPVVNMLSQIKSTQ